MVETAVTEEAIVVDGVLCSIWRLVGGRRIRKAGTEIRVSLLRVLAKDSSGVVLTETVTNLQFLYHCIVLYCIQVFI